MYIKIPRLCQKRIYCFAGTKEDQNWYFGEYKISAIAIGYDKEVKRLYCNFLCDNANHCGAFIILSMMQMLILPFRYRVYFNKKKAKKRQHMNWEKNNEASDGN